MVNHKQLLSSREQLMKSLSQIGPRMTYEISHISVVKLAGFPVVMIEIDCSGCHVASKVALA